MTALASSTSTSTSTPELEDLDFAAFACALAHHLTEGDGTGWRPEDALPDRLHWDSLAHVEVAEWLEGLGVHLPDGLLVELSTLGDLHHYATSPATRRGDGPPPGAPHLAAVAPADHADLFRLFTTGEHLTRYRLRGTTPSPEVFHRQLWDRVLVQFAVRAVAHGPLLGLVTAFDPDLRNRHVHVAAVADPDVVGSGLVAQATMHLVDHLFAEFDLRKVCAEALEQNLVRFASGAGRWFEVEGRLRAHEYVGGAYEDLILLAATREAWTARRQTA